MANLLLAAYTTPLTGAPGYSWIWSHERLSPELLSLTYSTIKKPTDVTGWSPDFFWGGLISIDPSWCAIYRFLPAGRDARGRQGRFFLVAGFFDRSALRGFDLLGGLQSANFNSLLEAPPTSREFNLPATSAQCPAHLLDLLQANLAVQTSGSESVNQLVDACAMHFPMQAVAIEVEGKPGNLSCSLSIHPVEAEPLEPPHFSPVAAEATTRSDGEPPSRALPPRATSKTLYALIALTATLVCLLLFVVLRFKGMPDSRPYPHQPLGVGERPRPRVLSSTASSDELESALSAALADWRKDRKDDQITQVIIKPNAPNLDNKWSCRIEGQLKD